MREDNLLCLRTRGWVKTTFPGTQAYPNLIPNMAISSINQLWVADITYIRLRDAFIYLADILDAFSQKCIGWELLEYLDTSLPLSARKKSLVTRSIQPGRIHHSDQQARKGNPYDNARAESFIKTLKYEEVYLCEYQNIHEARQKIDCFINEMYNEDRHHSSLGYLPPSVFEEKFLAAGRA
ncbi:MAG: integrase core domain-containing protein [Syntrophorhabdus sp.]